MRCRRICRELLWLARFGEFGPSSAPHLEHLSGCQGCRDEVGFDRAMVQQLRIALQARIADASPSSSAWERILVRAQTPEPRPTARLWEWSAALVARLRVATAMAGTGLALILALNMEIVPAGLPPSGASDDAATSEAALVEVPRVAPEPNPLAEIIRTWGGGSTPATAPDPEAALVTARVVPAFGGEEAAEPHVEDAGPLRLVFRVSQTPDMGASDAPPAASASVTPLRSEPGEPS
jgi:hypothetical protein